MGKYKFVVFCILMMAILLPVSVFAARDVSEGERLGKPCAGCHATDGYAPGEYIARIAGQNKGYMAKVMKEFATGKRPGSVEMSIIAKGYDDSGIMAVSEYYGAKKWKNSTNTTKPKNVAAGKNLVKANGCFDCHGVKGVGSGEIPRIGGQNKMYLSEVLKRYKNGQISSEEMAVVKELTEKQLADISEYLAAIK